MNLLTQRLMDKPSICSIYCPFAANPPRKDTTSSYVLKAGRAALLSMFAVLATPLVATVYSIGIICTFAGTMAGSICAPNNRRNIKKH